MSLRPFVIALTLTAALPLLAAADEPLREQSVATVPAAGLKAIQIENSRGRVEIHPSADPQIHLSALKVIRAEKARQQGLADAISVEAGIRGDTYRVRVIYPQRREIRIGLRDLFEGIEIPSSEVRLMLDVPAGLNVRVTTTSGDIASFGLASSQRVQTTSGDVEVDALGPLEVATTSGDVESPRLAQARIRTVSGGVEVKSARGPLAIQTTSGQIVVRDAADSLSLGTVSGDIEVGHAPAGVNASTSSGTVEVRDAAARVFVESSSGDVTLRFARALTRAEVVSGTGNIDVKVPAGLGVALEMHTSNGELSADLGLNVQTASRRLLAGRIGSGATPVVLRSSSGDILVQKSGEE